MPNHWHLVLRPRAAGALSEFMRWITVTHVRRYHGFRDHPTGGGGGGGGHVYQGRYKCFCVADDAHFLTLCRYVEANPLRAKLAARAEAWPWSSLHQRLTRRSAPPPPLASWPVDRPPNWTALVNRDMETSEIRRIGECLTRDRPFGSAAWTSKMAQRLGLTQTLRSPGRPPRPMESLSARQRRRRRKSEVKQGGQNGK
jgi:putative transposase